MLNADNSNGTIRWDDSIDDPIWPSPSGSVPFKITTKSLADALWGI
jgi:hypothetical protein